MRVVTKVVTGILVVSFCATLQANTYGSVEPIANPAVIDTTPLRDQPLKVREAFARRLLQCGIVSDVVDVLSATRAIRTINGLNTHVEVGAGGFAGETNPSFVYTVLDEGPNAASIEDVQVLTNSLGYVLSQGSAFLLDADPLSTFGFLANYVVLNFDTQPPLAASAALFRTVGRIDRELFDTDTPTCRCSPRCPTSGSSTATSAPLRSLASSTRRSSTARQRSSREARTFPSTTGR
jgi:hypothetical protein